MPDLPELLFADPAWHALQTEHRSFRLSFGDACRYPADVTPFAAVASPRASALAQLATLLEPGESVWLFGGRYPNLPELRFEQTLECDQMVLPAHIEPPPVTVGALPLSCADSSDMVALTDLAFPGFFRPRTCAMGEYVGIRDRGQLIAMGGERLVLPGYPEISGVCTHPLYRGKGYAEGLIWQLVRNHRRVGLTSWLHVGTANRKAIKLYLRLGFERIRTVTLTRLALSNTTQS